MFDGRGGFGDRSRMKRLLLAIAGIGLIGMATADHHEGWVDLFNGKDTSGWKNPYEWGEVKVVDGEIHLSASKKFFLVTEKTYGDFVFEGEVHLPEGKANSGFMYRCHVTPNKVFGYQAEVDGSDRRWSGGLYDEGRRGWIMPSKKVEGSIDHFKKAEVQGALKRNGWNKYRIECKGDHLQVWVNGVQTTDVKDATDAEGHIGIQHHGEKGAVYRFRNLRIKE